MRNKHHNEDYKLNSVRYQSFPKAHHDAHTLNICRHMSDLFTINKAQKEKKIQNVGLDLTPNYQCSSAFEFLFRSDHFSAAQSNNTVILELFVYEKNFLWATGDSLQLTVV